MLRQHDGVIPIEKSRLPGRHIPRRRRAARSAAGNAGGDRKNERSLGMQKLSTENGRAVSAAQASAFSAVLLALFVSPVGRLVGHFHVSTSVATAVVTIITGGGGWVLSV